MDLKEHIECTLVQKLEPAFLDVYEFTQQHAGHVGYHAGGRHFLVEIVAQSFENKSRIERERMVTCLFDADIGSRIHALRVKAKAPSEAGDTANSCVYTNK